MRFTEKISGQKYNEDTFVIDYGQGVGTNGKKMWFYVALPHSKFTAYMEAKQRPNFSPVDFGEVFASGYDEPDTSIIEQLKEQYGIDHYSYVSPKNNE